MDRNATGGGSRTWTFGLNLPLSRVCADAIVGSHEDGVAAALEEALASR